MEKQTILIVEDDTDINNLLKKILTKAGYPVRQAFSGTEAKLLLSMEKPDLILLDLMLPGMSGEAFILFVRGELGLKVPVIVLSAKSGLESKVAVLGEGADDYITKPFEPAEMLARIGAVLRRCGPGVETAVTDQTDKRHTFKKLCLNEESHKVTVGAEEITLTPHEYDILLILLKAPEKVFSRERLYELVWKNGYYGEDNTVNVHVSNIRKKIMARDTENEYIKTVWGIGFKMA